MRLRLIKIISDKLCNNRSKCINDLVKRCSEGEKVSLKSIFHKHSKSRAALHSQSKICIVHRQREYESMNSEKKREVNIEKTMELLKNIKLTTEKQELGI